MVTFFSIPKQFVCLEGSQESGFSEIQPTPKNQTPMIIKNTTTMLTELIRTPSISRVPLGTQAISQWIVLPGLVAGLLFAFTGYISAQTPSLQSAVVAQYYSAASASNSTLILPPSVKVTPSIKWVYGWKDGDRANTVGSAKNGDPIPQPSDYLTTGYSPAQIRKAYGFDKLPAGPYGKGKGSTIVIVVAYGSPYIQSDLDYFCETYKIPSTRVKVYYPQGIPSSVDSNWAFETTLDVEWAHAMAPDATIDLVVGNNDQLLPLLQYAAELPGATVVSASWGAPELSYETNYDQYLSKVPVVVASGDDGSVTYPSCSPYALAVGASSLIPNSNSIGGYDQPAWTYSGGGVSLYEAIPSFQTNTVNSAMRTVPDVSYNGDPNTGFAVYYTDDSNPFVVQSGWQEVAGTSAGTPQWAAILAIRNSLGYPTSNNQNTGSSQINELFYSMESLDNNWPLVDVTNGATQTYDATPGYDLVTGLGTPLGELPAITQLSETSLENQIQVTVNLSVQTNQGTTTVLAATQPTNIPVEIFYNGVTNVPNVPGTYKVEARVISEGAYTNYYGEGVSDVTIVTYPYVTETVGNQQVKILKKNYEKWLIARIAFLSKESASITRQLTKLTGLEGGIGSAINGTNSLTPPVKEPILPTNPVTQTNNINQIEKGILHTIYMQYTLLHDRDVVQKQIATLQEELDAWQAANP